MTHTHDTVPTATIERRCDVAVIGGSAAGLAAALQLSRQHRSVIVVDDDTPRNAPATHMHGYLGQEGTSPARMREIGREEVRSYGGEILPGRALDVTRTDAGFSVELSGGHRLVARRVIVATGVTDVLPDIPGLAERWGREVIHCPFCHGFEVRDQRVVHLVTSPMGLHPASLMRHLTADLTIVLHDPTGIDPTAVDALAASGVTVIDARVEAVTDGTDAPLAVALSTGESLEADAVLTGTTFRPRISSFEHLGLETTPHPNGLGETVTVDATGRTSIDGCFAAGDIVAPTTVIAAAGSGALVGAQVAFSLAADDIAARARPSAVRDDWDARYSGPAPVWSANPNGSLVAEGAGMPVGRALDIGAGEGADALWLAEQGWTVTATDVSSNALARVRAEADRRGIPLTLLRVDANAPDPYGDAQFDLVSLQYGSFRRTPDQRALRSLLGAVAPGGTLLTVGHDLSWTHTPIDRATQTAMWDPRAYVGIDEIVAAIEADPHWRIEVNETRPRPSGAASTHHVHDVVLRAVRVESDAD